MELVFSHASEDDSEVLGKMVVELTEEICLRTDTQHFDIDLPGTVQRCREFLKTGKYAAILCSVESQVIGFATLSETYALYAGGKIGVVQEFYIAPAFRSCGAGAKLIEQVKRYGVHHDWACVELCTPPLPEFERTLDFYQRNGLIPVGGRKMREMLDTGDIKA